jgi:cell division protein FtsQ
MLAAAALNRYSSPDETPQDVRWMNAAAAALVVVAVLMVLAAGLLKLGRLPYFDLQRVQIEGDLTRNNLATVRANTVPRLYGSFFQADLVRSRAIFESVPWVRKAVVRRVWPNQLRVTLEEHQPAAYWRQAHSEDQLVNTFGEVFDANRVMSRTSACPCWRRRPTPAPARPLTCCRCCTSCRPSSNPWARSSRSS